jgi:hypothetical protein
MSNKSRFAPPSHLARARQPEDGLVIGPLAYDVPEVLRRLAVTRPTLYRFLRSGELRSSGGPIRVASDRSGSVESRAVV